MFTDSHCHLNFPDLYARLGEVRAEMAQAQVDQHLPYVERRCQEVSQELERARLTIKGRIQDEYDRMRHGESVVGDALAHTREMLEEIIDLTPPDIQRCIYPTIQEVQCVI